MTAERNGNTGCGCADIKERFSKSHSWAKSGIIEGAEGSGRSAGASIKNRKKRRIWSLAERKWIQ